MDFGPMFGVDFDFGGNNEMKLRIKGFCISARFILRDGIHVIPLVLCSVRIGGNTWMPSRRMKRAEIQNP